MSADDFDDVPAMRREIQRLNERIERMTDAHFYQLDRLISDRFELAKWVAGHEQANFERAAKAVDAALGDTHWRKGKLS